MVWIIILVVIVFIIGGYYFNKFWNKDINFVSDKKYLSDIPDWDINEITEVKDDVDFNEFDGILRDNYDNVK